MFRMWMFAVNRGGVHDGMQSGRVDLEQGGKNIPSVWEGREGSNLPIPLPKCVCFIIKPCYFS